MRPVLNSAIVPGLWENSEAAFDGGDMITNLESVAAFNPRAIWSGSTAMPSKTGLRGGSRVMFLLVFLCGSLPRFCYADQQSVDEILRKVSETYQNLQSYQFVAEKITEVASVGSIEPAGGGRVMSNFHKSMRSEIMLAASNPGKFRLDVKDEGGAVVLVSDGQTKWTYIPKRKQYTEEAETTSGASDQFESRRNAQPDILKAYRGLLVDRFRGLSKYSSTAVLENDNQLKIGADKVACYVLKIQTQQEVNEIWVDKDRFIVWRSKHIGPSASEGISFQTTVTINLTEAKVNTELEGSLFQFMPPRKP